MKNKIYNFLLSCPTEWNNEILEKFKEFTDPEDPDFCCPMVLHFSVKSLNSLPIEHYLLNEYISFQSYRIY